MFVVPPRTSAADTPDGATVVSGNGRAHRDGDQTWTTLVTSQLVAAGSTVEATGPDPLDLTFPDGVQMHLEPGTSGHFRAPGRLPTEHNGWARGYVIELDKGEIDVRVPSDPPADRAFLVVTNAGTLTDWRGSVHLFVQGSTTAAAIYEGALVIGSNGDGFPVLQPGGVVIKKGSNPERSRGIPASPTWLDKPPPGAIPPFAFVKTGERATLGVAWAPSDGASSYRVELARDAAMTQLFQVATTTQTSFTMSEPVPASSVYYARVRAVADEGIVGNWSTAKSMRVLRVTYPPGASIAKDGAIMMREHQFVSISDSNTLEAAFENYTGAPPDPPFPLVWVKAPSQFEMGDDGTRVVHVRDPAFPQNEFRFVLGRRELNAAVDVCPKHAQWRGTNDGDTVNVRVTLQDPSNRLDTKVEQVTIETTVSGGVIPVEWRRSGASFYARVPPQAAIATPPYMLSVSVKDPTGAEIGSGFLEVDGPATARAPIDQ
jgi:hypothetical protein